MAGPRGGSQKQVIPALFPMVTRFLQMFDNKIIYYYSLINCLICSIVIVVQLIDGLKEFNAEFWFKPGLIILPNLFMNIQLCGCLITKKKWQDLREHLETHLPWNLSKISPSDRDKIQQLCKHVEHMFMLQCFMSLVTGFIIRAEFKTLVMERFHSALTSLGIPITPFHDLMFVCGSFAITGFMAIIAIVAVYYVYDFANLIQIQRKIFVSVIKEFQETCSNNRYVRTKLIFLIKRHQIILRLVSMERNAYFNSIVLGVIGLIIFLAFSTILLYLGRYGYIISLIPILAVVTQTFYFAHQGELFQEIQEELPQILYDIHWYEWDAANRKMFLILLLNSRINPQSGGNFVLINHEFFTRMLKIVYTVANFILTNSK